MPVNIFLSYRFKSYLKIEGTSSIMESKRWCIHSMSSLYHYDFELRKNTMLKYRNEARKEKAKQLSDAIINF
jgi:hypothetical protein